MRPIDSWSIAVSLAMVLVGVAALPALGAYDPVKPEPLRRAQKLRAQEVAARGDTVLVGWREGGRPDRLFMALSRDGGASFLRGSGKLRRFNVAGLAGRGLSLTVCGPRGARSMWAATALRARSDRASDSDVLLTRRGLAAPKRDALQQFVTSPTAKRQVRDADLTCVGDRHLAIAWVEKKDGRVRARLAIRRLTRSGVSRPVRTYKLGRAVLRGGISVAATPKDIHVAWIKGDNQHLRYERFSVVSRSASRFERGQAAGIAWRDLERPQVDARGRKVVVAYSDGGDLRVKLSRDRGASFGPAESLAAGSQRKPARARSVALSGQRIVVEGVDRTDGTRTPTRFETTDLGVSWTGLAFGHNGIRLGALEKIDYRDSRLKELLHHDGGSGDTLRARREVP